MAYILSSLRPSRSRQAKEERGEHTKDNCQRTTATTEEKQENHHDHHHQQQQQKSGKMTTHQQIQQQWQQKPTAKSGQRPHVRSFPDLNLRAKEKKKTKQKKNDEKQNTSRNKPRPRQLTIMSGALFSPSDSQRREMALFDDGNSFREQILIFPPIPRNFFSKKGR